MTMIIIMAIISIPIFILGLFMRKGKGLMLLAGYNTLSDAEREKIDKKVLSKLAGNLLLRVAVAMMLLGVSFYFNISWLVLILLAIIVIDPCIMAIRMSRLEKHSVGTQNGKSNKVLGAIAIVIAISSLIAVGVMFYFGEKDPDVVIGDGVVNIVSMYGLDVAFSDITSVTLDDRNMNDIAPHSRRTNGFGGFGDALKGHFTSDEFGKMILFVQADVAPTILMERKENPPIFISLSNAADTEALYHELKGAISVDS